MQLKNTLSAILLGVAFTFSKTDAEKLMTEIELAPAADYCVQGGSEPKLILTNRRNEPPPVYIAETDSIRCNCYHVKMRTDIEFPLNPGIKLDCTESDKFYEPDACPSGGEERTVTTFYQAEIPGEYIIPTFYLGDNPQAYIRSLYGKTITTVWESIITCSPKISSSLEQEYTIRITGACPAEKRTSP